MATSAKLVFRKRIGLWSLVAATYFMVSGGPYGLEDIVKGAGYWGAILLLVITPVIWALPTASMVAELSSAIPEDGGYYVWVIRAAGRFWGFQEAWLSLAASIFDMAIYPTLFVAYLSRLLPGADAGWHGIAIGALVIAACVLWNLAGGKVVGDSSLAMLIVMFGPFVVLTAVALMHWQATAVPPRVTEHSGFVTGLLVCMWNYMGFDNAANVGGEVDNPQKTYPLAMIFSIALITLGYVIPIAAMSHTGISPAAWTTGAWATLGGQVAGRWVEIAIVIGGMIAALATFNSLTMSYSRLPMAMAQDRLLPKALSLVTERTGAPWLSIVACALLWGACLGLGFERLVTLDVILWGASMVLEFMALVLLRLRQPELYRPFRVPGGIAGCALLGVPPTALVVLAALHGGHETIAGMNAMIFGGLIVIAGFVAYAALRQPARDASSLAAREATRRIP